AHTEGTVSISQVSDTEFEIRLTDFTTGHSDDLRLYLSPGTLERHPEGHYYVTGEDQYELPGTIDPTTMEQVFRYELGYFPPVPVHVFTVYDYAGFTAFGSAALS
ncbi:MAG TPA: hypothetical protein PK781_10140, partial [Terrimesophilobacter sp.]|nr:hypothetical protein [Terrimesophilobacter sp.]